MAELLHIAAPFAAIPARKYIRQRRDVLAAEPLRKPMVNPSADNQAHNPSCGFPRKPPMGGLVDKQNTAGLRTFQISRMVTRRSREQMFVNCTELVINGTDPFGS